MQALEMTALISENNEIHLTLPKKIDTDIVKVIIMYEEKISSNEIKNRVFGQFKNQIFISDDFDAELPESYWLGTNI